MNNCCYSFFSGVINFFVDSQATRTPASFRLQLFIGACLSNNERKTEFSCAAVNITAESRYCFISCINIQLSIEESFLLQVNVGGGLGTNKSKSHTIVKWSDVS